MKTAEDIRKTATELHTFIDHLCASLRVPEAPGKARRARALEVLRAKVQEIDRDFRSHHREFNRQFCETPGLFTEEEIGGQRRSFEESAMDRINSAKSEYVQAVGEDPKDDLVAVIEQDIRDFITVLETPTKTSPQTVEPVILDCDDYHVVKTSEGDEEIAPEGNLGYNTEAG